MNAFEKDLGNGKELQAHNNPMTILLWAERQWHQERSLLNSSRPVYKEVEFGSKGLDITLHLRVGKGPPSDR